MESMPCHSSRHLEYRHGLASKIGVCEEVVTASLSAIEMNRLLCIVAAARPVGRDCIAASIDP